MTPTTINIIVLMLIITFSHCAEFCVLFNYDTDTGGASLADGRSLPLPYGQNFRIHGTIPRFSDGKLYIDFLCDSLNITYLNPYLDSLGLSFLNGVNFAFSGSTALDEFPSVTYPLSCQVRQFQLFQLRTTQLRNQGKESMLLSDEQFKRGVHSIDIGQNDLFYVFINGTTSIDMVAKIIPRIVHSIEMSVKTLYRVGARKFILYNTGPLGCLPIFFTPVYNYSKETDEYGCRLIHNRVAKQLNRKLAISCEAMTSDLYDATIVCVDMFSIKYDLFANPAKYGFENPLQACYAGGSRCPDPSKRVSLDGTHYTEAANSIIAARVFSGGFWWPNITFSNMCHL